MDKVAKGGGGGGGGGGCRAGCECEDSTLLDMFKDFEVFVYGYRMGEDFRGCSDFNT